jgi:Na+/H+ antiporter NhaD/arsenite permease-like protein
LLLFWLSFRKQIPKVYDTKAADNLTKGKPTISPLLLRISLATLAAIDIGFILTFLNRFPVPIIICSGVTFSVAFYWFTLKWTGQVNCEKKGLIGLAKDINWDIMLFKFSIFLLFRDLKPLELQICQPLHYLRQANYLPLLKFLLQYGNYRWCELYE